MLTIILPTYNEEDSLKYFIPEIIEGLKNEVFEIIVVDDSSSDNTVKVVNQFIEKNNNLKFIQRNKDRSLPLSIYEGIKNANNKYVMWLDADGSMDVDSIKLLINNLKNSNETVFVGSRFVKEGGYKGKNIIHKFNFKEIYYQLVKSEDSLVAIYLSLIFNKILSFLLPIGVKDLTSGFIVGKKDYFYEEMFLGYTYGEYFINVISSLYKANIEIQEVGYICKPRKFGVSKTSTSIFRLFSLSKPYIKTSVKLKRELSGN